MDNHTVSTKRFVATQKFNCTEREELVFSGSISGSIKVVLPLEKGMKDEGKKERQKEEKELWQNNWAKSSQCFVTYR